MGVGGTDREQEEAAAVLAVSQQLFFYASLQQQRQSALKVAANLQYESLGELIAKEKLAVQPVTEERDRVHTPSPEYGFLDPTMKTDARVSPPPTYSKNPLPGHVSAEPAAPIPDKKFPLVEPVPPKADTKTAQETILEKIIRVFGLVDYYCGQQEEKVEQRLLEKLQDPAVTLLVTVYMQEFSRIQADKKFKTGSNTAKIQSMQAAMQRALGNIKSDLRSKSVGEITRNTCCEEVSGQFKEAIRMKRREGWSSCFDFFKSRSLQNIRKAQEAIRRKQDINFAV